MLRANQRSKFAELRALRQAGKKAFDVYEVKEEESLYEEVDEESYKKIVRERLNQDDFVVDDNGEGYADDGREDWDRVQVYETDSEDERVIRGRDRKPGGKKAKDGEKAKDANDRDISAYFAKGTTAAPPKPKVVKTEADDQFMADLLGEVDANILPAPVVRAAKRNRSLERPRARVRSPVAETRGQPAAKRSRLSSDLPPTPPVVEDVVDDGFVGGMDLDDVAVPQSDPAPSSPAAKAAERKVQTATVAVKAEPEEEDDTMEVAQAAGIRTASVNISGSRPPKKLAKPDPYPSPEKSSPAKGSAPATELDASSWNDVTSRLNVVSGSPSSESCGIAKIDYKDAVEADGSVNVFWTDYAEVKGSLCLFGKVKNKRTGAFVSCFIKIDNIMRKLYFLPRPRRVRDGVETDEEVDMSDVYGEVDAIMDSMGVKMHKIKPCTRKYAFELKDIPREARYLKLLYPYTKPQMEMGKTGETFSHVFGTNTSLFEQFVLWKNIMGPCWLKITDADFGAIKNSSHCKLEILCEHPNMVAPMSESDSPETPPLTLMSLAMRTTFNSKDNKQELLAISARIYENVSLSDTTPADKLPCRTFTLVRPNGPAYPVGFETLAKKHRSLIKPMKQEADMLNYFLAQMDVVDPDVIIGHQLEGVDYSILLNRLHEKKIRGWSRLGRLRRTDWPPSIGKVGGNVFAERQIISGRLLCDLANDAGKSTMYKCQSWSLTEMCSLYLSGDNNRRRDVDNEAALKTWATTRDGLMDYLTHMEADTYFIAALALKVQLLPLTKVLTNLAGNSWARTLTGTRAERNEYILLHEFHRNKYVCPDKQPFRGRSKEDENDEENGDGKKKDKYKGGLVFEPEKGLYDKFVLVMDFNSLYPSIIQEFNICFTTVDRSSQDDGDEESVPDVPSPDLEQGILPRLIATLVSRRREVKKLMKDKTATPEQLATWDIKQLALKLTANSMYGCLGYTKSRFYARPLAVLTTFKGREILRSTKELAESKALQVIYGDTDSVMINANVENVTDALKVGNDFKRAVNERYRLLEIDIDNVFRRILLQAKKKYAAVNMVETAPGKWVEKLEVKGLDMKRREYCALSKDVSSHILNEILSGDDTEAAVRRIHEYLRETVAKMRDLAITSSKYIIFTQLGKHPKEYPNADSMPQVQVALRDLARGKTVRRGDVVSYIVTTGNPDAATGDMKSTSSDSVALRAYSPPDVLRPNSGLVPDVEWYVAKQIFPPVERLCANITGTSTTQLAEALGLDIRRYATNNSSSGSSYGPQDLEIHPLDSQLPDALRFRDCTPLTLRCRACKTPFRFLGLADPTPHQGLDVVRPTGLVCPSESCGAPIPHLTAVCLVDRACRTAAATYYEGWTCCEDAACPAGGRTRQVGVLGNRCLGGVRWPKVGATDCGGKVRYEVSEKAAYTQLLYLSTLFDVDRARARAKETSSQRQIDGEVPLTEEQRDRVLALAEHNRARFTALKAVVDRYLDKCGRQWVAMDTLFAKLGFAAA